VSKKHDQNSRRDFLKAFGALGASFSFLPSLLSLDAKGQSLSIPKRLVLIRTAHGTRKENWEPLIAAPTQVANDVRVGQLQTLYQSNGINKLLDANFVPYLNQLTFIKGLDILVGMGHNAGGAFGHFAYDDGFETIDQYLARSAKFYQGFTPVVDSLIFSPQGFCSYINQNGELKPRTGYSDPRAAFDLFFNLTKSSNLARNSTAIESALKRYQLLKTNPRLSVEDKKILDTQMYLLSEMGNKFKTIKSVATPTNPIPSGNLSYTQLYEAYIDVGILTLFNNLSKILVINIEAADGVDSSSWHAASHDSETQPSPMHYKGSYWAAQKVFLRVVQKMSEITEANGRSMLDNSLVFWGGEMSQGAGHVHENMPAVLAGSAQGFIKPGQILDYSQYGVPPVPSNNMGDNQHIGRPYNQLLNTILQSMGMSPSDYERNGKKGYGISESSNLSRNLRYKDLIADVGNVLPNIR